MSLLEDVWESKPFKFIANISVIHWLITVVPGLISGIGATMHDKPIEIVVLYFVGACALMLIVVHYGQKEWNKYVRNAMVNIQGAVSQSHWKLLIPVSAFMIVLVAWVTFGHHKTTIATQQNQSNNGQFAPKQSQPPSGEMSSEQKPKQAIPHPKTAKKHSKEEPESLHVSLQRPPLTDSEKRAIVEKLIKKYQDEHPGEMNVPVDWINEQLAAARESFHVIPKPAVLDNVVIDHFGSTGVTVSSGTVIMKGHSLVTGEKVGIENNGGQVILQDDAKVTGNETGIVNNTEPKKKEKEPAVKPPPQP